MGWHLRVHLTGVRSLPPGPVVLVANHESFWDGFLGRRVQQAIRPEGSYHAVMLERELARRPFLRRLGAIGIVPGSVSSVRSLLATVLTLPESAVLAYFPQGVIRPGSPLPLGFRPGLDRLLSAMAPATVVPMGLRVVGGRTRRSEAYLSLGPPLRAHPGDVPPMGTMEDAVATQVEAVDAFLAQHGEAAPERWPQPTAHLSVEGPVGPGAFNTWISRN